MIDGPIQLTWENRRAVCKLMGRQLSEDSPLWSDGLTPERFVEIIPTEYGNLRAHSGDWIYRDESGNLHVLMERVEG